MPDDYQKFRVYMRSAPGMWARYDGHVDVWSPSAEEAFPRAVRELARTSFPDRPSLDSWRHERTELLKTNASRGYETGSHSGGFWR